ncbi:DnaA/Hda family protein [Megalodesulfovibrio paquesii]
MADEDEKRLVVTFPHSFFADWFRGTVQDRFEEAVSQFLEPGYTITYEIGHSNGSQPGPAASPAATKMDFPFGREFTFETFISNKKNYFPVASAKSVAKSQDATYNPFCICGESGSGKTHLMRAMANEVSKTCEKQRIFFGSMEDFAGLVTKIRREGAALPRQAMQQYQFLFVDDFHRLREDFTLQEELIQIFDSFHETRRQMVFCSPEKITACDYLLPSLKSRMEWGLVVLLARQDVDIRARYIQRMCDAKKIRLSKEQMLTLAQRFESFRYLQGIMLKLFAFKELVHRDIQDEDFARILEYTENRPEGRLSAEEIQARVAEHFGLTMQDLVSDRRQQNVVFARQVAMFLCRELTGVSYPGLGRLFGGKDHSTAMYAVRKVAKLQKDNKDIRALVAQLKKKCS